MGKPFSVKIKVARMGNGSLESHEEIEVTVDTGASFTSLPRKVLARLGIPAIGKETLRLADNSRIERNYGLCAIFVANKWVGTNVLFGEDTDEPLLGTNTIDEASVAVDVISKQLVPVQALQAPLEVSV